MVRKREKVGEDVGKDQEEGTAFKPLPLPQTSLRSVTGSDADVYTVDIHRQTGSIFQTKVPSSSLFIFSHLITTQALSIPGCKQKDLYADV